MFTIWKKYCPDCESRIGVPMKTGVMVFVVSGLLSFALFALAWTLSIYAFLWVPDIYILIGFQILLFILFIMYGFHRYVQLEINNA